MSDEGSEETTTLRDGFGRLLDRHHSLKHLRETFLGGASLDRELWGHMTTAGYPSFRLTEKLGGLNGTLQDSVAIAAICGARLVTSPLLAAGVAPSLLLAGSRDSACARSLASALCDGSATIVHAYQEQLGLAGFETQRTALTRRGGRLLLNGRKILVETFATHVLVICATEAGPAVVAVETGGDLQQSSPMRMADGTELSSLLFEDLEVDPDAVILSGEQAQETITRTLNELTIILSAQLSELASTLLNKTRDYLLLRRQFGEALANQQALRHRLVDLHSSVTLARAVVERAVALQTNTPTARDATRAVHAAKARCSDVALTVARSAIQMHGAIGFTDDLDIGLYFNTALRWASWFGNAPAHREAFLNA